MFSLVGSLFNRQWWWATLLVVAAMGVMIRLGIWQLDRLEQRQAFNSRVNAQLEQPPLMLAGEALYTDLANMEYRAVVAVGVYDVSQQVAIRNQAWENQFGVHLLTPLVISGSNQAVLVDRGWIPAEDADPEQWGKYDEPGIVKVEGIFRASRSRPDFGGVPDPTPAPGERLLLWNNVNVPQIAAQMSHTLVPVYIQQAPDPAWTSLPYRDQPTLDLTEGPHMGYALQWFTFATVLGLGYPVYVRYQMRKRSVTNPAKESGR